MEKYQQENRNTGTVKTGVWDATFASTTIQRRPPVASLNATSTRNSRVTNPNSSNSHNKRRGKSEDDDDEPSSDEIDMLSPEREVNRPILQKRGASQSKKQSGKAEMTTKTALARRAKPPATRPVKPSRGKRDTSDSESDPLADSPQRIVVEKKSRTQPKAPAKAKAEETIKKGKQQKKPKKINPIPDIEEIAASETDADESVTKPGAKLKVPGPSRYEPRPFPMDLSGSPPTGSSRAPSSIPSTIVPTRSKPVISSKSRDRRMRAQSDDSSDSEPEAAHITYTQAVRLNEEDPNTLCPFCDEKLPESPSHILIDMLEKLKRKATPDPRYGNSLGLKLDMSQYISFCARHTAESEEFPKGEKYGWPTALNPSKLTKRIWKLKSQLQAIIDDPDEGTFFRPLQETATKYGKSAVTGAKGSWATFENASTGYYGEQGLALITQVLFDMFPSIPGEKITPLELSNYYSLVLVPEVALLLILGDLQGKEDDDEAMVTRSKALKVLRKSTKYGIAVFPAAEGDKSNFGDDIARQRARKMRKLREQEEQEERIRTSSQSTDVDVVLDLSSDDAVDNQKTPVPKKRRARQPPFEDSNGPSKTTKRKAFEDDFDSLLENPKAQVERKVSKKINLDSQPGALGQWSDTAAAKRPVSSALSNTKGSFSWLLDS